MRILKVALTIAVVTIGTIWAVSKFAPNLAAKIGLANPYA